MCSLCNLFHMQEVLEDTIELLMDEEEEEFGPLERLPRPDIEWEVPEIFPLWWTW